MTYTTKIYNDSFMEMSNPRDWANVGTMICFHKRYTLGDDHDISHSDYNSWEDMKAHLLKQYAVVLPMYLYDHSGITVSTTPFSCPWDSGQVGFIVASRDSIKETMGITRLTKQAIAKVEESLRQEVLTYASYVSGDVYEYIVENEAGDVIESICGIIGSDNVLSQIPKEYQENVEWC